MTVTTEVKILALGVSPDGKTPILLLADKSQTKALPLLIGQTEAFSIGLALSEQTGPSPFTHELITNIIEKLNFEIVRIVINGAGQSCSSNIELRNKITPGEDIVTLDARTTDAISLALWSDTPIHVTESLFVEYSVDFDTDGSGFILKNDKINEMEPDGEFKKFVSDLKASDFSKYKFGE